MTPKLVSEKTSSRYSCDLKDQANSAIPAALLTSLTLSLFEVPTGTFINSRNAQNVLNANNVTVDALGHLIWLMQPADNVIVNAALSYEPHRAEFIAVWPTGEATWSIDIVVQNLVTVT